MTEDEAQDWYDEASKDERDAYDKGYAEGYRDFEKKVTYIAEATDDAEALQFRKDVIIDIRKTIGAKVLSDDEISSLLKKWVKMAYGE